MNKNSVKVTSLISKLFYNDYVLSDKDVNILSRVRFGSAGWNKLTILAMNSKTSNHTLQQLIRLRLNGDELPRKIIHNINANEDTLNAIFLKDNLVCPSTKIQLIYNKNFTIDMTMDLIKKVGEGHCDIKRIAEFTKHTKIMHLLLSIGQPRIRTHVCYNALCTEEIFELLSNDTDAVVRATARYSHDIGLYEQKRTNIS